MTTQRDRAVAATPEKAARWEDFIDVIFSPGQLFDRRAGEPWLKPFLILAAVSVALYYLLLPITGAMIQASMVENAPATATPAQVEQSARVMKLLFGVMAPIFYFITVAGSAIAIKFVAMLFDGNASWRQSFAISTFAYYITVLQSVAVAIGGFLKTTLGGQPSGTDASFGLLRFIDVGHDPLLRALLARTDLFAIWAGVLFAIGLVHVIGMPRGKAAITAALVWVLIALPAVAMAAFR